MLKINTKLLSRSGLVLGLVFVAVFLINATRHKPAQAVAAEQAPAPQVGVVTLKAQEIVRTTELPGRTNASLTSEVRPQVNGVIQQRLFREGSEVKQGQQLYQIDPATYKAAYDSACAALSRNQAALSTAKAKEARYKKLLSEHVVSQQDYDDVLALAKEGQADIVSAQANVEQARINLEYTKVLSPISGRIGHSAVTPGALVTANQSTPMATVTTLDPVFVDLSQPVATLLRLKKEMEAGEIVKVDDFSAEVTLKLEDGTLYDHKGRLQFSEVTVDQGTGTVLLRAVFPNPVHTLLPGMYVRAVIQEGVNLNALVIPQKAVGRNAQGESTVLVVGEADKLELKTVELGPAYGESWIVSSGLKPGERVVVDGKQNVRPGSPVQAVEVELPRVQANSATRTSNS